MPLPVEGMIDNSGALPVATPASIQTPIEQQRPSISLSNIINRLTGMNGEERYQLWPEKLLRDALSAPHDIMQKNPYPEGSEEHSWYEDKRQQGLTTAALNMASLAGIGGLGGAEATLGAGPILRPALKYGEKLYKGKPGQQHMDVIPEHLYEDFKRKAMSGDDINDYNFGFINDKGHFLDRQKALDYAINNGLINPNDARYGALVSDAFIK